MNLQSKTIDFLRFPMMVMIVFIHIGISKQCDNSIVTTIYTLFSQILSRIGVPLFFVFSGYLFFFSKDNTQTTFNKNTYLYKLKKRAKTLLVPYLFWNALMIVFVLIMQKTTLFLPYNHLSIHSLKDFLLCFFDRGTDEPILFQFWFIRDLMILCVLSPIVYFLIRYLKLLPIMFFLLVWFWGLNDIGIKVFERQAICFFFLGAYLSINKKDMVNIARRFSFYSVFAYLMIIIVVLFCKGKYNVYFNRLSIIVGMIAVLYVVSFLIEKDKVYSNKTLSQMSFFLFAIHTFMLQYIQVVLTNILPHNDFFILFIYFVSVIITIIVSIGLFKFIKHFCPYMLSIMIGQR